MDHTTSHLPLPLSSEGTDRPEPRTFHSSLAASFLDEWHRLRRSPVVRRRVLDWEFPAELGGHVEATPEHPLDRVLRQCGFLEPNTDPADRAMLRLVDLARHDELAARVALQRMLPGLVAVGRRRGPLVGGAQRAFEEAVASAWIAIRTYPIDKRPRKVAANLVRDAEYLAFVQPRRLRAANEFVGLPRERRDSAAAIDGRRIGAPAETLAEVVDLLAHARGAGIAESDLRFATAWLSGADTVELARRFGCCERTVRNRRREVASRLRQVALVA